jgi:hypothetical protein
MMVDVFFLFVCSILSRGSRLTSEILAYGQITSAKVLEIFAIVGRITVYLDKKRSIIGCWLFTSRMGATHDVEHPSGFYQQLNSLPT